MPSDPWITFANQRMYSGLRSYYTPTVYPFFHATLYTAKKGLKQTVFTIFRTKQLVQQNYEIAEVHEIHISRLELQRLFP
jgi:hypothetical protein